MKHGVLESRILSPKCPVSLSVGGSDECWDDDGGDADNGDHVADDGGDDETDQSGADGKEGWGLRAVR